MTIFAPLTTNPVECSANTESVAQRAHNDKRKKAMEEKIVLFSAFWNDADKDFDGGEGAEINSLELTRVPFRALASHLICSHQQKVRSVSVNSQPHELWHEITSEEHLLCLEAFIGDVVVHAGIQRMPNDSRAVWLFTRLLCFAMCFKVVYNFSTERWQDEPRGFKNFF